VGFGVGECLASADEGFALKDRARLGPEPLEALFRTVAQPMATDKTIGAFYRGLQVMSIDATTIDLADTEENEGRFGRPGSGRGEGGGAFSQVRVVGLGECGTHGIVAASFSPLSSGEATLAPDLLPAPSKGMLCWPIATTTALRSGTR